MEIWLYETYSEHNIYIVEQNGDRSNRFRTFDDSTDAWEAGYEVHIMMK